MKAVQIKDYAEENVLDYTEVNRPEPNADEILVKIKAAAVNPVILKIRNGNRNEFEYELPIMGEQILPEQSKNLAQR